MTETRVLDIRIYKLEDGGGPEFHRLVHEESTPLVKEWGHDVIAYGPSATDPNSYFVIRAYASVDQMQKDQDEFYSSDAWRQGPREAIVALIEEQAEAVLEVSGEAVEALRGGFVLKRPFETPQ